VVTVHEMTILHFCLYIQTHPLQVEPFGVIRKNWNDTEKISMAPAQG